MSGGKGSGNVRQRVNAVVGAVTPLAIAISMFLLEAVMGKYRAIVQEIMTCAFLCGTSTVLYALHYVFHELRVRKHGLVHVPYLALQSPVPSVPLPLLLVHEQERHHSVWNVVADEVVPIVVAYICGYALSIMLAHISNILIFTLGFVYFIFMRLFIRMVVELFSKYIPDFYKPRYLLLYGAVGGFGLSVVGALLTLLYVAVTGCG